jgi:hypothetical protein
MHRSADWEMVVRRWSPLRHAVGGRIDVLPIVLRLSVELKAASCRRTPKGIESASVLLNHGGKANASLWEAS